MKNTIEERLEKIEQLLSALLPAENASPPAPPVPFSAKARAAWALLSPHEKIVISKDYPFRNERDMAIHALAARGLSQRV